MKRVIPAILIASMLLVCCKKPDPIISVDGLSSYNLSAAATTLSLRVNTNCDTWVYDAGGAGWLEEKSKDGNDLYLSVAANTSTEKRSATITFYAPDKGAGSASASVSVTQAGAYVEPEITVESGFEAPADGASFKASVSTNLGSWEFSLVEGGDWISAVKEGDALKIEVASNPLEDTRTARYRVFAPNEASYKVFKDITVTQQARVIEYDPVNLSADGTSNCYIITHKGVHSFDATVRGNGATTTGLPVPTTLAPAGAKLVWQTAKGMIKSVSFAGGIITFEATRTPGSAVIAATDANGSVIWSWHIWYPAVEIEGLRCETGDEMMNVNLGALDNTPSNISSHGMLYQWGRKDPFPYSPLASEGSIVTVNIPVYNISGDEVPIGHTSMFETTDNTLAYSIAHPDVCISNNATYSTNRDWLLASETSVALWGNPHGSERTDGKYNRTGAKSIYDPCPKGWRVAPVRDYVHITESAGYTWAVGATDTGFEFYDLGGPAAVAIVDINEDGKYSLSDYQDGWTIYLNRNSKVASYFPAATRYDGQYAMLMGSMVGLWANYWTNTATPGSDDINGLAIALSYGIMDYNHNYSITISPVSNGSRADAYSVRCIKEQ